MFTTSGHLVDYASEKVATLGMTKIRAYTVTQFF